MFLSAATVLSGKAMVKDREENHKYGAYSLILTMEATYQAITHILQLPMERWREAKLLPLPYFG
jgi:hypothetical protein